MTIHHDRRGVLAVTALATLSAVALAPVSPRPLLVFNATASAPIGFYALGRGPHIHRGDLVLARLPFAFQALAAERGYLPRHVGLVKRVVAVGGDRICSDGMIITVNGRIVAKVLPIDSRKRILPHWTGCQTLAAEQILLVMSHVSTSFDGRYFGPISRAAILGRLTPLWTW